MFWLGALGPGAKGAGILYAQDRCPIMNQHPLSLALVHHRALVLGVWIKIAETHLESRCCLQASLIYNVCLTGQVRAPVTSGWLMYVNAPYKENTPDHSARMSHVALGWM